MSKKWVFLYILLACILFGLGIYLLKTDKTDVRLSVPNFPSIVTPTPTQVVASQSAEFAKVQRVIDGDTIVLSDGRRVRYIGMNTPELHHPTKPVQCFGEEADD